MSELAKQLITICTGVLLGIFVPQFGKLADDVKKRWYIRRRLLQELEELAWVLGEVSNDYGRALSNSIVHGTEETEADLLSSPYIDKLKSRLLEFYTDKEPEVLYQIRDAGTILEVFDLLEKFRQRPTVVNLDKAKAQFNILAAKQIIKWSL